MNIGRIVNSVFDSNTFVIRADEGKFILVDCGDYEKVRDLLGASRIVAVLLTHVHFDHIYGLPKLLADFPDCKVYTNREGIKALASSKLNFSRYHGEPVEIAGDFVTDIFSLADSLQCESYWEYGTSEAPEAVDPSEAMVTLPDVGMKVRVLSVPGHSPSSLAFGIEDMLFTGDSYIPGIKVVTNLPHTDKEAALANEARLRALADRYRIMPGHGEPSDFDSDGEKN